MGGVGVSPLVWGGPHGAYEGCMKQFLLQAGHVLSVRGGRLYIVMVCSSVLKADLVRVKNVHTYWL